MQPARVHVRHDGNTLTNTDRGYRIDIETQEVVIYLKFTPKEILVAKRRANQLLEGLESLSARWELEDGGFRGAPGVVCKFNRNMNLDSIVKAVLLSLAKNFRVTTS